MNINNLIETLIKKTKEKNLWVKNTDEAKQKAKSIFRDNLHVVILSSYFIKYGDTIYILAKYKINNQAASDAIMIVSSKYGNFIYPKATLQDITQFERLKYVIERGKEETEIFDDLINELDE
jgi:hypothetical protein